LTHRAPEFGNARSVTARNALRISQYLDSIFKKGKLTDTWGTFAYAVNHNS
jgi:hypothetical protein